MGKQETIFLNSEGDAWHDRNKEKPFSSLTDPVIQEIKHRLTITHCDILEIGCGQGRRIGRLQQETSGFCMGIDPSPLAIGTALEHTAGVDFIIGGAADLPKDWHFHLIIYGFCLYVCDREDLQKIASNGDDILQYNGHIIIHDFDPDYPHKVPYHHVPGLFSYKMDYSKLWLANPAYSLVTKTKLGDGTAVWVLKKDIEAGWPLEQLP